MTRRRGDGNDESPEMRFLAEQNKLLKRKLRALTRDNSRIRKEKNRWKTQAEHVPEEEAYEPPARQETGPRSICPRCRSEKVYVFELEVRGVPKRYFNCMNKPACGKRGKMS